MKNRVTGSSKTQEASVIGSEVERAATGSDELRPLLSVLEIYSTIHFFYLYLVSPLPYRFQSEVVTLSFQRSVVDFRAYLFISSGMLFNCHATSANLRNSCFARCPGACNKSSSDQMLIASRP